MLTVKQAAERATVCESIVRQWVASGQLPHFRLGAKGKRGKIAIAVEDLDALVDSFKVGKREPEPVKSPARNLTPKLRHLRLPSA